MLVCPTFAEGRYLLDNKPIFLWSIVVTHNNWSNRKAFGRDKSFKFLPHQLSMVVYWTTMAFTGNGGLGFDSGEGAWETATTSKEGSRRVNYPILTQGGSDKKYQYEAILSCNWNEHNSNSCSSIDWRASLVPAAAVIPAPIAYIKVVAVKKLVVGVLPGATCPPQWWVRGAHLALSRGAYLHLIVWCGILDFYFEEIRVFQAGSRRA